MIYKVNLMDHYHNPRNKGKLTNFNFESDILNPTCGDSVQFQGIIKDGKVIQIVFNGVGCIISQATASILADFCKNKLIKDLLKITADDIIKLIDMELGPKRSGCALLPLEALHKAINNYNNIG